MTRINVCYSFSQNPLLAASNAVTNGSGADDDKLSDYVPESRDLSVSRAVSRYVLLCRIHSGSSIICSVGRWSWVDVNVKTQRRAWLVNESR